MSLDLVLDKVLDLRARPEQCIMQPFYGFGNLGFAAGFYAPSFGLNSPVFG